MNGYRETGRCEFPILTWVTSTQVVQKVSDAVRIQVPIAIFENQVITTKSMVSAEAAAKDLFNRREYTGNEKAKISFILPFIGSNCIYLCEQRFSSRDFPAKEISGSYPVAKVPLFPVRGNHEGKSDLDYIVNSMLPAYAERIHRLDRDTVNYFVDWKNVRIIVIDQFSEIFHDHNGSVFSLFASEKGNINSFGKEWTEGVIDSAGDQIDHIFVAFHEPAFPRNRHVHESFDKFPASRNEFWNMQVRHKNKVRAVLVGHTHYFSRMRVKNALSVTDESVPNQKGEIFQIDCGTTGRHSYDNTIIEVNIRGKKLLFRTLQLKNDNGAFHVIDQWEINVDTIPKSRTSG